MYTILRSLLFRLPPETAHQFSLSALRAVHSCGLTAFRSRATAPMPKTVMGVTFPNPVGLAAGMDKDGRYLDALGALGFGFIEVGTVTPRPQSGNPRPRLFRIPGEEAIINRMGFNNEGVEALVERLKVRRYPGRVGVNIGKNRDTPLEDASADYRVCLRKVYAYADYIAINISSPNTPGLRDLQEKDRLRILLDEIREEQQLRFREYGRYVPIAVKISPDLEDSDIEALSPVFVEAGVDGIIATNTTLSRPADLRATHRNEEGGLSGAPLRERSTQVIRRLHSALGGRVPLIGVGGIMSEEDTREKIDAGADLVQLYTGFVYRGPGLIRDAVHAFAPNEDLPDDNR